MVQNIMVNISLLQHYSENNFKNIMYTAYHESLQLNLCSLQYLIVSWASKKFSLNYIVQGMPSLKTYSSFLIPILTDTACFSICRMVTRNTRCVWVRLKDCDGLERQPTFVNVQSDEYLDDVIKACLAVSKVNIAPNLVKVFSADDSTDPIETVIPVDDLIRSNRGTISSPLLLQCPQWKVMFSLIHVYLL